MYRSNRSFHIPPGHTPCTPRAFDTFAVPGRREFDYQSLPGGGEFDPRVTGVGNLNCIHDFMWNLWRGELSWGTRCWGFSWKRLCLCGQLVTRKGLKQALCGIWRYLNFNIFNMNNTYYQRFNTTIESSTEVNNTLTCCISLGGIFLIQRFVCCMTRKENLSIQWPCSSNFRRFAQEFCS